MLQFSGRVPTTKIMKSNKKRLEANLTVRKVNGLEAIVTLSTVARIFAAVRKKRERKKKPVFIIVVCAVIDSSVPPPQSVGDG